MEIPHGSGPFPITAVSTCAITLCRRAVTKLGQPLFAADLNSAKTGSWRYDCTRNAASSHCPKSGRTSADRRRCSHWSRVPGKPASREQDIGFLRDRLTVMGRSVRANRLTPALAAAMEQDRLLNSQQLAQLEASQG